LVKPSESKVCLKGLKDAKYIGCSSLQDWAHVKKWKVEDKAYKVIHGISEKTCIGTKNLFRKKFNIPENKKMFLSCGGYWPNKKMIELAEAFTEANLTDATLVTTGYDNRHNLMPTKSNKVMPLMVEDPQDVKNAIADAYCYVMNSDAEGFGLVLLEAMLNKTPWISRNIAGAQLLSEYGTVYNTEKELIGLLKNFKTDSDKVEKAYQYVVQNHLIKHTIDDILNIIDKA
jgi:glycosyltransferase involved in cell wall biosynthesis